MKTISRVRRAAAVLAVAVVSFLPGVPAMAHGDQPRILTMLGDQPRALPSEVVVRVIAASDREQIAIANPTATPLVVLAPDGSDFVRISAAGVEVNEATSFFYTSRMPPGADVAPPAETDPADPQRWAAVSTDVSWRWYDPRLHPDHVRGPAADQADQPAVLAAWSIPLRYGNDVATAGGTIDWVPATGRFGSAVDPPPSGVAATVIINTPPRVVLNAPGSGVTVLGESGEPLLRTTPDGAWEGNLDSPTYRASLLADARPVPTGGGWRYHSAPGLVSWVDVRLRLPGALHAPASAAAEADPSWSIPLVVDGRQVALTGSSRAATGLVPPQETNVALLAVAGLAVAAVAVGVALVATRRRGRRSEGGGHPSEAHVDEGADVSAPTDLGAR